MLFVLPAVQIAAAVPPAAPLPLPFIDSLGGYTLGMSLNTIGWQCESSAKCERRSQIGGLDGILQATLCGSIITHLHFARSYVAGADLLVVAEVAAELEKKGTVVAAFGDAETVSVQMALDIAKLRTALQTAGWNNGADPEALSPPFITVDLWQDEKGRQRSISVYDSDLSSLGLGKLHSPTVMLSVGGPYVCTAGL